MPTSETLAHFTIDVLRRVMCGEADTAARIHELTEQISRQLALTPTAELQYLHDTALWLKSYITNQSASHK